MLNKLNSAVRTIQDRTGLSYQGALVKLRTYYASGLSLEEALARVLDEAPADAPGAIVQLGAAKGRKK